MKDSGFCVITFNPPSDKQSLLIMMTKTRSSGNLMTHSGASALQTGDSSRFQSVFIIENGVKKKLMDFLRKFLLLFKGFQNFCFVIYRQTWVESLVVTHSLSLSFQIVSYLVIERALPIYSL